MTITQVSAPVISQPGQQIALSSLLSPGSDLPSTIGVAIWDDNNYTLNDQGLLGYLSGNGARTSNNFQNASDNQDYAYALFTYDAAKGEYYNSTLGYWNNVTYVAPTGASHAELLTLFSFKNGTNLTFSNLTDFGDVSVVVPPVNFTNPLVGATPGMATPNGVCAVAKTFVGSAWSDTGCALLVQEIAALAGTSTPFTAVAGGSPQQSPANNEWYVAYDGSAQSNPTIAGAEALIRAGDIVSVQWPSTGHNFIVVSGSGANALVVDNESHIKAQDGSPDDIIITSPHTADSAINALSGPIPSSVAIYRLDTPILTAQAAPALAAGSSLSLASLFTASDPTGKAVTLYQIYDTAPDGKFAVNGEGVTAHSAATALSVQSLASIALIGGAGNDDLEARGFNGSYWGDWQSVSVTAAPAITAATAGQASAGSTVVDNSQNVAGALDSLATLAAKGTIAAITLTDGAIPNLTVTAAQFTADKAALNDITSAHTVTVQMSGTASQHDFSSDHWAGASALRFTDQTVIIAATPGTSAVTTGNVTELYSAVLAREPDIGGLAFYQNYLKANPGTPLIQFAEWFLTSSEYSAAHSYAQTTAGETQFITDSYQNLLHRAPSADEVTFYLTKVLEQPGSQLQNHAQMLVYFSASAEFLGDVQITAANPANAQHWLFLT